MLIAYLNITTDKKSDELNKTKYFLKAIKGPWSVNTASWPWFCCRRQILSVTHFWICKKWLPSVQFCYSFRCLPWIFIESLLGFQHCTGKDKVSTLMPPGPLKRRHWRNSYRANTGKVLSVILSTYSYYGGTFWI